MEKIYIYKTILTQDSKIQLKTTRQIKDRLEAETITTWTTRTKEMGITAKTTSQTTRKKRNWKTYLGQASSTLSCETRWNFWITAKNSSLFRRDRPNSI